MNFGPQHSLTDPAMLAAKVPELLGEPPQLILELLIVCDEPTQATSPFCQQIGFSLLVAGCPSRDDTGPGRRQFGADSFRLSRMPQAPQLH